MESRVHYKYKTFAAKFVSRLQIVVFIALAALCINFESAAQSSSLVSEETTARAHKLANYIEQNNLVLVMPEAIDQQFLAGLTPPQRLIKLRTLSMDAAFSRINLPLTDILAAYEREALNQKSDRDVAIAKIIQLQDNLQYIDLESEAGKADLQSLQSFRSDSDWFVAQRAALMESVLPTYNGGFDIGLRETQAALTMIPNKLSNEVFEAQYETYDNIAYLQFILNNIDLGISTSEQVIEKGLAHGREIDGISLINNMNYAFNSWHEYETAEKLAEVLFRLNSKSDASVNSLVYFRYGQAQSNAGHYQEAIESLNIALANTTDTQLILGIEMARATAYAGIGKSEEAVKCLKEVTRLMEEEGLSLNGFEESKLRVLSLIAMSENNAAKTAQLSNARLKSIVQTQLDRQSKGIQSLQANLENDKNRQTERETALMRETELKQSELEAKQRSNVFLMALAASLLIIAIFAIGFAVWRQKISKILTIAAHDAEAGDRAKSQFLSVMSHELRTPLNGIIGIAGILSEKGETKELRNYNKLILKSGETLLELLSGILDMAQMESGKLSIITAPTSIRQIIDGLYQSAKADVDATKVQFTCFVSENVPDDLMLDSIRIKQSLSNLIANAVRFTDKGRIHLHTTMSEPDGKGVRQLTMIVADTGRGITEDVKAKLFKPFVQADSSLTRTHDGAGIGLAVTRGLSRLMGGDVTMTSTAGRGSEFKMVVKTCIAREAEFDVQTNRPVFEVVPSVLTKIDFSPAVSIEKLRADAAAKEEAQIKQDLYGTQQKSEAVPASENSSEMLDFSDEKEPDFETIGGIDEISTTPNPEVEPLELSVPAENPRAGFSRNHARSDTPEIEPDQLSGLNILVVEDIEANQEILSSLLVPVGCSVSCAINGQIAVDMMKTQTFDAVLMDIRMPVLDGIAATKAIRNLPEPYCNTAIIALTADASAENNAECLAAGADVFLTKPVIVSELFSSIRFARLKQMRQKQHAMSA